MRLVRGHATARSEEDALPDGGRKQEGMEKREMAEKKVDADRCEEGPFEW